MLGAWQALPLCCQTVQTTWGAPADQFFSHIEVKCATNRAKSGVQPSGKKSWLLREPERNEVVNQVGVIHCWNRDQSIVESKEL